ncbi:MULTISPECIES: hypothetical protein [unclassified Pseudomonas]|jgi:hypothetical protein|uniref:hypothetical protein n=1 Tax=unclassified Pseudomonas TaxID=196821 RepID=UPI00135CB55D|nr:MULTISPECIES: hypothetical protein [unclassified Pseudomonas]MDN4543669.1 hypothetical protein [Pseudomonas sp. C32]
MTLSFIAYATGPGLLGQEGSGGYAGDVKVNVGLIDHDGHGAGEARRDQQCRIANLQ